MKLKDCDCGGIPKVTYNFNDNTEFMIGCRVCSNHTPVCDSLKEAIFIWNRTYCCALPPHEMASF
jgi:hypothetical protein